MTVTIAAIDTIGLRIPLDIWAPPPMTSHGVPRTHFESLLVRVTTSNGIVGWGESFATARPMVIAAFDHWVRRVAVGQGVTDPNLLPRIERMFLSLRAGPLMAALSGLDIALWDIRGKLEGVPVHALIGGAKRRRVECYASLLHYHGYPEHLKRATARALERGYRWIKLHERTPEAVAIARAVVGPDMPLMVDINCAWSAAEAEAQVAAMAPYQPYWVEEPLYPPEDFETCARIRKRTGVPLGMGENATSLADFRTMVATGAADFVQPSIVKIGGITAMMKVAREVEAAGAVCVPNGFYVGPGYLAAVHCMAAKEKASPLERLFADLGAVPFASTVPVENGGVEVPRGPGLGADPEEELIGRFAA
jgi:L-alanine-DL-glutamate epimerase-like enolase superfamily enzyme